MQKGDKIRAREFHYFDSDCNGNGFTAVKNDRQWECVNVDKTYLQVFHTCTFCKYKFCRKLYEKL